MTDPRSDAPGADAAWNRPTDASAPSSAGQTPQSAFSPPSRGERGRRFLSSLFGDERSLSNAGRARRQKAAAAGAAVLLGGLAAAALIASGDGRRRSAPETEVESLAALSPDRVQRESYILQSEERMDGVDRRVAGVEAALAAVQKEMAAQTHRLEALGKSCAEQSARISPIESDLEARRAQAEAAEAAAKKARLSGSGAGTDASKPDYSILEDAYAAAGAAAAPIAEDAPGIKPRSGRLALVSLDALPVEPGANGEAAGRSGPAAGFEAPAAGSRGLAEFGPDGLRVRRGIAPEAPADMNRLPGSTVATYLPPGAFARSTLLTGVYASTAGASGAEPMPVLMKIEDPAVLPNRWKTDVRSCHVTGTAAGDLSSERVLIRLDRLSCVSKSGRTLDVRVQGYGIGSDGKVGVKGRLVTRSGSAIAAALSVSLLEGVGRAVSLSSQQTTTSSLTGSQTVDYTNAWTGGLGQGLAQGMDRIAAYYLKLADKILPVLEVDAGASVDLVISRGVLLAE